MADASRIPETKGDAGITALLESEESVDAGSARRLVDLFAHPDKTVRRRAADRLAVAIRDGALSPAICEAELDSDDPVRRWSAAFALGRAGRTTPRVIDVALAELGTADGDVRWAAATIVTAVARVIEDVRTTLRRMATGPDATMRKMAVLCLADAGDRDSTLAVAALGDDDVFVRLAGLTALGRLGDSSPSVLAAVERARTEDPDVRIRRAATAIRGRLEPATKE